MKPRQLSKQTRTNWLVVTSLLIGGVIAGLSGIYFLFLPSGGYMGGRNPWYGITILFDRHTWEDVHVWGGLAMVAIAAIHIILHWGWITMMARRMVRELRGRGQRMNGRGRSNVLINMLAGLGFIVTAITGVYLFLTPHSTGVSDPSVLFSRTTWDIIHTWAAVLMLVAASLHIFIHWGWITKVTRNIVGSLRHSPTTQVVPSQVVTKS